MQGEIPKARAWLIIIALFSVGLLLGAVTQINLTTQVTGILPTANGGTNVNGTAVFPASGTVMTRRLASQLRNCQIRLLLRSVAWNH